MYSNGPPHMAKQMQNDQRELTYSSYVKTQDVTLKTCRRRWMIGRSGERGSGISVLAARHDDDDDDIADLNHFKHYLNRSIWPRERIARSAGVVKYTDCISVRRLYKCPDITLNNPWWGSSNAEALGNVECLFIVIAPISSLTGSGSSW